MQRGQHFAERRCGERPGVVGHPVRNSQLPAAQDTAAVVNEVGEVAFALVFVVLDEWLAQDSLQEMIGATKRAH